MFGGLEKLARKMGWDARADLIERSVEVTPFGQILVLESPPGDGRLKTDAVSKLLHKYIDGAMPFAGILVDLSGTDYRLSSADLGSVASSIAAWVRGWVAPCAIVLRGGAAVELQKLLNLTKLSSIEPLRIVGDADEGMAHIRRHLERRAV